MNFGSQVFTEFSVLVILVLTVMLSLLMSARAIDGKSRSMVFWTAGLWLFSGGVVLELVFASGTYSPALIKLYLGIVAILVEALALGSIMLLESRPVRIGYMAFCAASTAFLAYSLYSANIGNLLSNHVVFGPLPLSVTIFSSLITFPAAVILIAVSAYSYRKTHSPKMLSIIAGVVLVSAAGTLYIAKFPSFLYYAEFAGILLLWAGFFSFRRSRVSASQAQA